MEEIRPFWTCWVDGSAGGYGYRHWAKEDAYKEAERLAQMPSNHNRKVFVMEMVAACQTKAPVDWLTIGIFY